MLAIAVAKHLAASGLGLVYSELPPSDLFIDAMPDKPDRAVMVTAAPGLKQGARSAIDTPGLQVIVRDVLPGAGADLAGAIYGELTCLDGVWLDQDGPDEVWLIGLTGSQSGPIPLGIDDGNRRHEWSLNFDARISNPTTHRPAFTA